ncbi:MAG: hypothetical protein AAF363_08105 [Bacteroidota bacterium]
MSNFVTNIVSIDLLEEKIDDSGVLIDVGLSYNHFYCLLIIETNVLIIGSR